MNITDYLDKVVNHEAGLTGGYQDLLAEGVWHKDAIATVTEVAVECSNTTTSVVASLFPVLR